VSLPYLYDPLRLAEKTLGVSPPLTELLSEPEVLKRATEILEAAVKNGTLVLPDADMLTTTLSVHAALVLTSLSGSPFLMKNLVNAIYTHTLRVLSKSSSEELERIAKGLGLDLISENMSIPWLVDGQRTIPLRLRYSLRIEEYLPLAVLSQNVELHLSNSFLRDGRVFLDRSRLVALLAEVTRARILSLLDEYRVLENRTLRETALKVAARLEAARTGRSLNEQTLPACIREIMENGVKSDIEAYILVSFLKAVNAQREDVERILLKSKAATPAALENITDAILAINRLYTPYKCDTEEAVRACRSCKEGLLREYLALRRSKRRGQAAGR
jgi:DNA primase large subunit